MATYMSGYIEVDHSKNLPPFSDPGMIISLTEGSFDFGKDYEVFDALAGGRSAGMSPENREPNRDPLVPPKGMPSPCSPAVGWGYFRLVADAPDLPNRYFWPEWRCVSSAVAAEWLRENDCHEAEFFQWFNCAPEGRVWRVVSEPDFYNATWLWLDEFDAALKHHGLDLAKMPVVYRIIRTALSLLIEEHGRERARLVVWFC